MTLTLSVKNLPGSGRQNYPVFVAGLLYLDANDARLYDRDCEQSVNIADQEACSAIRAAIMPSREYFGWALAQVWVRGDGSEQELHSIYWLHLHDELPNGAIEWGIRICVRPVPEEYDYIR